MQLASAAFFSYFSLYSCRDDKDGSWQNTALYYNVPASLTSCQALFSQHNSFWIYLLKPKEIRLWNATRIFIQTLAFVLFYVYVLIFFLHESIRKTSWLDLVLCKHGVLSYVYCQSKTSFVRSFVEMWTYI